MKQHSRGTILLIDKGADADARAKLNGWTPLMIAVAEGHVSTTSILLQSGAKPNITNSQGRSALMFAAWYGNKELVAMLLKAGADPNIVPDDREGMTALMAATTKGYKEIVTLLLDSGANPNIRDKKGRTALWHAKGDVATLLRQAEAKD
jgi:ankyrin repeat protein